MRIKIFECARCGTEICAGEKYKVICGKPYCIDCALREKWEVFDRFDELHPTLTAKESEKF